MTIASAQTSFYASDDTLTGGNNPIVRSWDNGRAAITYYTYGSQKYFQYVNYLSGQSYRVEAPGNTLISDMYIDNNIVYYCGSSSSATGNWGIIGYFNPADFLFSNVTFRTLQVPPLTHIRKLVAQPNGSGGNEVIALGEHEWGDTSYIGGELHIVHHLNRQFVFCHDIMQNVVVYDTMLVNFPEIYHDVLLTDHYVVFVGKVTTGGSIVPCLRIRDRNNPTLTGLLSDAHFFYSNPSDVHSAMHSTAMNADYIATAYMHTDPLTGIVTNRIRVINVGSIPMWIENSQEYIVPEKSEITDIVFIPHDKSVVCMHDFKNAGNLFSTNFIYIEPSYGAPYIAKCEFLKEEFFKSLTRVKETHFLASLGPTWFMKNKTMVGPYPNPYCPLTEKVKISIMEEMTETSINYPLPYNTTSNLKISSTASVEVRPVSVICNNH